MRRESKSTTGSVVKDRRSQNLAVLLVGRRQAPQQTLGRFPTKTAAWNAAQQFRRSTASTVNPPARPLWPRW